MRHFAIAVLIVAFLLNGLVMLAGLARLETLSQRLADLEAHAQAAGYNGLTVSEARQYAAQQRQMMNGYWKAQDSMDRAGVPR